MCLLNLNSPLPHFRRGLCGLQWSGFVFDAFTPTITAAGTFASIARWAYVRRRRCITILIRAYYPIVTISYMACAIIVTDDVYIHEQFKAHRVRRIWISSVSKVWIALLTLVYDPISTPWRHGAPHGWLLKFLSASNEGITDYDYDERYDYFLHVLLHALRARIGTK